TVTLKEDAHTIEVVNRSSFDLRFTRSAVCNASGVTVLPVDQLVKKGETFQAPLPADHTALKMLVDRQAVFAGPLSKSDVQSLMAFFAQDVQTTQYMIGINASAVRFDERSISHIDVSVFLVDVPGVEVPSFTLVKLRTVNQANVLIPVQ